MIKNRLFFGILLTTAVIAICFINVIAAEDWKSKYRDVQQIEGTEYFLIHLYDVQIGTEKFYATGVADKDGNIVLPVEYAFIDAENYSDGRRLIATFGKNGFVDENFIIVIEPLYDRAQPFENGAARVQKNNPDGTSRVFYIDVNGNEVDDPTPEAERDFEYYRLRTEQELNMSIGTRIGDGDCAVYYMYSDKVVKYGIINVVTREVISPQKWDNIVFNNSGEIWGQIANLEGAYDTYAIGSDGAEDFKFKSERIVVVWEKGFITILVSKAVKQINIAYSTDTLFDAVIPMLGLMDKKGNVIIEPDWEVTHASMWSDDYEMCYDGYLPVISGSNNYQFVKGIGTMGDGKWGCITTEGRVVIEPMYDNIEYNGNNKFTVVKDGKTDTIDLSAKEPTAAEAGKSAKALPTSSPIFANGKRIDFEAYLIDGYNYFKLRDIACALNGTAKQFEVAFDSVGNVITLTSGESYTVTGGELKMGDGAVKEARPTPSEIYLDGVKAELTAYNISGYNYFKLRDFGSLLNFAIDFDTLEKVVSIDTDKGYAE